VSAPTDLSFETQGAAPGSASAWTLTVSVSVLGEGFARADGGLSLWEGFEFGWGADPFVGDLTVPTTAEVMQFEPGAPGQTPFDGFEHYWNNDGFLFELGMTELAAFVNRPGAIPPASTSDAFDGFEGGWNNAVLLLDLFVPTNVTELDLWNSTLDAADGFEREWGANESYVFDFSSAPPTPMQFNEAGVLGNAETFESFIVDQAFTIDGNTIVVASSPYHNGDLVTFFPSLFGGSVLPSPLSTKITYTVASATPTTFTVTVNGVGVVLNDSGSGQNWVRGNASIAWSGLDGDMQGEDP
jgi:hypothetical protein